MRVYKIRSLLRIMWTKLLCRRWEWLYVLAHYVFGYGL